MRNYGAHRLATRKIDTLPCTGTVQFTSRENNSTLRSLTWDGKMLSFNYSFFNIPKSSSYKRRTIKGRKWSPNKRTVKTKKPFLGIPTPVFAMKIKQRRSKVISKINLSTTVSMKMSGQKLSVEMVIDSRTFKNTEIKLIQCFTFIVKTGMRLPTTETCFYSASGLFATLIIRNLLLYSQSQKYWLPQFFQSYLQNGEIYT